MYRILAVAFLLALGACSSSGMDEAECKTADWRAVGYEDGARGASPESFGARRKACAEHGVTAGFDRYLAGHAQGLEQYCKPQKGYRLGAGGTRYSGVCPDYLEPAYLAAHARGLAEFCRPQNGFTLGARGGRYSGVCPAHLDVAYRAAHADGYGLYERQAAMNSIAQQIASNRERSKEIEFQVVEKTALLISPAVLATERAIIAVELKQLAEEKTAADRAVYQLEGDYAAAQRDYQAYRNHMESRYGA